MLVVTALDGTKNAVLGLIAGPHMFERAGIMLDGLYTSRTPLRPLPLVQPILVVIPVSLVVTICHCTDVTVLMCLW